MIKTVKLAGYELRRFKGPLPILGLLFLILIPTLCGGLYLWANWDPFGKTDQVPVAVVNLDQPVQVEGRTVDAGDRLVTELRADPIFNWQFVDEQQALDGLAEGTYDMVITIPPDFSENLVSGASADPQRAVITITRDDVNGYGMALLTSSVRHELEAAIDRAAIGAYLDTVFANLATIKTDVTTAATAATVLAVGADSTLTTSTTLTGEVTTAGADSAELTGGLATAKQGSTQLVTGISQAQAASAAMVTSLTTAETGVSQLVSPAGDVASGTAQLASSLGPAIAGVDAALPPLGQSTANVEVATANVADLVSAAGGLSSQVTAANAAIAQLAAQNPAVDFSVLTDPTSGYMTQITDTTNQLIAQSSSASQQAASAGESFDALNSAASQLSSAGVDLTYLATTSAQVSSGMSGVSDEIFTASSSAGTVDSSVAQLSAGATELDTGIGAMQITAQRLDDTLGVAETDATTVQTGVTDLDAGTNQLAADLTAAAARIPTLAPQDEARSEQVLSSPANLQIVVDNPATFYGRGLSPVLFGIAIWLFAIIVFLVVRPITGWALAGRASSARITMAGWLPALGMAMLGSLLLLGIAWLGLRLDPVNVGGSIGVVLLAAACFTAIAQLLRTWLGKAGSAVLLVLLMVQLTSAAGLYPVETLPAPFRAVHPFLPMTYLVDALRITFTGGPVDHLWRDVAVLAGLTLVAVGLCLLAVHRRRQFRVRDLHPLLT